MKRSLGIGVAGTLLLGTAFLSGCGGKKEAAAAPQAAGPTVTVAVAALETMERSIPATGTLGARQESLLGAKVPGRVQRIAVDVGTRVRRGDLLVQIEPADYEMRARQAEAALAQARAAVGLSADAATDDIDLTAISAVRQAKALLDEASANQARALDLSASGILSRADRDAVEASYGVARARYDGALEDARTRLAGVSQRHAEAEIAQKQLSDTQIRAPYDGIVRERRANVGEYVAAGAELVSLVEADPLRLRLDVPEREAASIRVGHPVRLRVEGDDTEYPGTIARVSPVLDEGSRMLRVEADVPATGTLRPGLFARARIVLNAADEALVVPADAIVTFAGIEKVVVVEDGKAREKTVTTGRREGALVEISEGLKVGESVIRNPAGVQTGQAVDVASAGEVAPRAAAASDGAPAGR